MLRRKAKRLLDRTRPLYVRREFVHGGQVIPLGVKTSVADLVAVGFTERQVETMFRLRRLGHDQISDQQVDDGVPANAEPLTDENGKRLDGPTLEEWVAAGYRAENYPPEGWAIKASPTLERKVVVVGEPAATPTGTLEAFVAVPGETVSFETPSENLPSAASEEAPESAATPAPVSETVSEAPATQAEREAPTEPASEPASSVEPEPLPEAPAPASTSKRKKRW